MAGRLQQWTNRLWQIPGSGLAAARRRLLQVLLLGMAAGALLMLLVSLVSAWIPREDTSDLRSLSATAVAISLALSWANRRFASPWVSVLACIALWLICFFADSPAHIYNEFSLLSYALPIVAASVLLRPWAGFIFAAATSLTISVMAWQAQVFPNLPAIVVYFLLALIAWLSALYVEQTIASLQESKTRYRQLAQEHLSAQEALRTSEGRYRFLAENMADVIWLLDLNTMRFTYVSPSVERLRGYTAEEVLAQSLADVITADSLAFVQKIIPERIRAYLSGDPAALQQVHEVEQLCKDGSTVWTEVNSTIFGNVEEGLQVLGVSRDISQRRKIEQQRQQAELAANQRAAQLLTINEVLRQVAATLDSASVLSRAARLIHEKFGYHHVGIFLLDEQDETLVMHARAGNFDRLFPSEHRIPLGSGMVGTAGKDGETLLASDVTTDTRYINFYPDRLPTRSELDVPLRSGDGILGVLDVQSPEVNAFDAQDVLVIETLADELVVAIQNARLYDSLLQELIERKRAEAQVRQLTEELERRVSERTAQLETSNKELEAFAYSVSHDLRAPLRAIHGFSRMMSDEYGACLDEHGQGLLRRVQEAAQRMGTLIDDLLQLSRLTRSQMRITQVNLSALAGEIASELTQQDPFRQADWHIAPDLHVQADPGLLRVVLENLLNNAWKFTAPKPQARIEVGSRLLEDGRVAFFVCDNGVGFDMAYIDKLFGPFQRLHLPEEFPGTGIGLATVQRIIARHGGSAWAEGRVDEGATFYFTVG